MTKHFAIGYDETNFSQDVVEKWGDLSEELRQDQGGFHSLMYTLACICKAHAEQAPIVLKFLDDVLEREDAISEIENAIALSFLSEKEFFDVFGVGFESSNVLKTIHAQTQRDRLED